jgi:transposase InsO family protein
MDNGSKFNGKVFEGFLRDHNIKHNKISPYHPQSNGLVERFHGTLVGSLRKYCIPDKQAEWDLYLGLALFGYQTSRTAGLERSPFYMCYGIDPAVAVLHQKDRKELSNVRAKSFQDNRLAQIERLNMKAALRAARSEHNYTKRNLKVGELVLRRFEGRPSKLHPRWDGPFIIHGTNQNGSYRLQSPNGHVHASTTNGD